MVRRRGYDDFESFRQQPTTIKIIIIVISTLAFLVAVGIFIATFVSQDINSEISALIPLASIIILSCIVYGAGLLLTTQNRKQQERRQRRKRRKQIREAELDQFEEGEQAMSPEELEERYNQRQAQRQAQAQNSVRRRPVLVMLNEKPSNEIMLKKMVFKGKISGKKCSICKLDLRKKQQIVQCSKCLALFHHDHLSNWLEKNNNCPVCNELLVE